MSRLTQSKLDEMRRCPFGSDFERRLLDYIEKELLPVVREASTRRHKQLCGRLGPNGKCDCLLEQSRAIIQHLEGRS